MPTYNLQSKNNGLDDNEDLASIRLANKIMESDKSDDAAIVLCFGSGMDGDKWHEDAENRVVILFPCVHQ